MDNDVKMNKELSIYIHFPFCTQKCKYCGFYSIDHDLNLISAWAQALINEIGYYSDLLKSRNIKTIYIGGGSPNLLPPKDFAKIVAELQKYVDTSAVQEFTYEMNPSNISNNLLRSIRAAGVDRISMGGQSFDSSELKILGRIHKQEQITAAVNLVRLHEFPKISLDLIFGIPHQTMTSWRSNLKKAVELGIGHLSLYSLTYEAGTPLTKLVERNAYQKIDEDLEWEMYSWAHSFLAEQGFEHYEISSWAKPDYQAIHNQIYWQGGDYIGFGPAAHSYYRSLRRWNEPDVKGYIKNLKRTELPPFQEEDIDQNKYRLERLFLSLRTSSGITLQNLATLYNISPKSIESILNTELAKFKKRHLTINKERLKMTVEGWFISNSLIAEIAKILDKYEEEK